MPLGAVGDVVDVIDLSEENIPRSPFPRSHAGLRQGPPHVGIAGEEDGGVPGFEDAGQVRPDLLSSAIAARADVEQVRGGGRPNLDRKTMRSAPATPPAIACPV